MQQFAMQAPSMPDVNIEQPEPAPAAGQEKPARSGGKDYYALLEKMAEEGGSEATPEKDKYMALLQAGLGTMAAASQPGGTFLGSIGQGGLVGVEGLQKLKAARAEDRMKKMTLYGTLAGRQEASEDRAAALAQAAKLAGEKLEADEKQSKRDDETRRLLGLGQQEIAKISASTSAALAGLAQDRLDLARENAPKGFVKPDISVARASGVPLLERSEFDGKDVATQNKLVLENQKTYSKFETASNTKAEARDTIKSELTTFAGLNEKGKTSTAYRIPGLAPITRWASDDVDEMSKIQSRIAPLMRQIGSGGTSNYDAQELKESSAAITSSKEVNANRIKAQLAIIQSAEEYEDFKNRYFKLNGTFNQADEEWRRYINANPVLDRSTPGTLQLNENRQTTQEFFYGDKKDSASGVKPTAIPGTAPKPGNYNYDSNGNLVSQ
jgi:hypothetical protein